ncbi:MAG TPA: tetratricopeptide repeat protein [Geomonas sp.]|nr:tetratricopeptide repeat protein [Geomonas sp.]
MAVEDAISFWTDIQRYENMLAADPRSYCFVPLSELYRKLGLLDDAISVALKGCGLHPDYPGGFFALGAAYHAKGENAEARTALESAVSLKPDNIQALQLLGKVYIEGGHTDLAGKVLGQALVLDPQDPEILLTLRSIGAAPSAQPPAGQDEEEVLEDIDLVEELTEEFEPGSEEDAVTDPDGLAAVELASAGGADLWAAGAFDDDDASAFEEEEGEAPAAVSFAAGGRSANRLPGGRDPLATPTMAELYVSQGFLDKAIAIYRELVNEEPANQSYLRRVEELGRLREQQAQPGMAPQPQQPRPAQAPAGRPPAQQAAQAPQQNDQQMAQGAGSMAAAGEPQPEPLWSELAPGSPAGLESELTRWLHNIRRRRDGV